jgi:hypothetical protein
VKLAALCALLVAAHAAQAQEPRPGVEHDSWRQIELASAAGADCLEIASGNHAIRLALADLRTMALDAAPIMGASTEARLLRIFEGRSQGLLGRISGWPNEGACVRAQALEDEDRYVIAELLKAGRAAVRAPGATQDAATIWIRHLGRRAGPRAGHGEILFYLQRGGEPFFTVSWWVS